MHELDHAHRDLALARQRLDEFQAAATAADYLDRLAKECPLHVTRLGMFGLPGVGALITVSAIAWLLMPLMGHELGLFVARVDPFAVLPVVLLVNAAAATLLGLAFRHLAVQRGRRSPMRRAERRTHAGLVGAVWRCEARLALIEADLVA